MAARRPFWKWHCWKSIASFPYTQVMWHWSLDLIFKAKLKLESGNQKRWPPGGHLKVTSMKFDRPLSMATNNMHIKFEIEIPKKTWVMLRKPCRLQTDGQTDRQIDGQGESNITHHHHHQLRWAGGINTKHCRLKWRGSQSTYVADNIFSKVNEKYEIG